MGSNSLQRVKDAGVPMFAVNSKRGWAWAVDKPTGFDLGGVRHAWPLDLANPDIIGHTIRD